MSQVTDNPGQDNRGRQEYAEESNPKNSVNQSGKRPESSEALDEDEKKNNEKDEKFSPGEADNYDPEEFNTD